MISTQPLVAALYARFSPRPNGETCISDVHQIEKMRAYCALRGWDVGGVFTDKLATGANTDRLDFKRAMKFVCTSKRPAVLVVYNLSRLSRSVKDAIEISERLRKAKVEFASVCDNIDTSTPVGRAMFTIMAAFAQMQRELNNERTTHAILKYQYSGRRMTSKHSIAYGLMLDPCDDKRTLPNPHESETLAILKDLHSQGLSMRAIAAAVNHGGRDRRGKPWTWRTVHGALKLIAKQETWERENAP